MRRITVDTTEAKACKKCGRFKLIYRHHKGNDGYLGYYCKAILGRYHQWNDCADLCFDCHCEIHYIYEPYVAKWVNRTPQGAVQMRKFLIGVADKWLAGKIPSPVVPEEYRARFLRSLRKWAKTVRGSSATGSKAT